MRKINSRTRYPHQQQHELSWKRLVVRKWLNIATSNSDYSADTDTDSDSESEINEYVGESRFKNEKLIGLQVDAAGNVLPIIIVAIQFSVLFLAVFIWSKLDNLFESKHVDVVVFPTS